MSLVTRLRAWLEKHKRQRARRIQIEHIRVQCAGLCQASWAAAERGDWAAYVRLRGEYARRVRELEGIVRGTP